jgi:hypothetical protein
MTNNYTDKLKELYKAVWDTASHNDRYLSSDDCSNEITVEQFIEKITALINRDYIAKEEVLSAIGEDDPTTPGSYLINSDAHVSRNTLRAEIKTKLGLEK